MAPLTYLKDDLGRIVGIQWQEPNPQRAENGGEDPKQPGRKPLWWCNVHKRRATHTDHMGRPRCNPALAGILLPCECVELTGIEGMAEALSTAQCTTPPPPPEGLHGA